jgi:uncharacterized membrane protein
MTTPPSDPYRSPDPDDRNNQSAWQPPPYPGQGQQPPPYPGQGQQPPGYPDQPAYGSAPEGARPPTEPPSSIRTAVTLMYIGAALSVLWTLLVLPQRDVLRDQLEGQNVDLEPADLDAFVNTFVTFLVILGVVSVGLWLWMAFANRRGRPWARVVATILGVLGVLAGVIGLFQPLGLGMLLNLGLLVLAGAILFLLYRPESSAYYRAAASPPRY